MSLAETTTPTTESRGPWKWALYTRAETRQSIPAFLWALKDMGGVCADKSGRAVSKVVAHAEKMGTPIHPRSHPSAMIRELESGAYAGAIERVKGVRQSYRITLKLADEQMPPKPNARVKVVSTVVEDDEWIEKQLAKASKATDTVNIPAAGGTGPRPADPEPEPKPHPGPEPGPRPDDPNVNQVALAVVPPEPPVKAVEPALPPIVAVTASDPLNTLLEIQGLAMQAVLGLAQQMGTGVDPAEAAERDEEKTRLAATLEENQRLRRKVNDLSETLVAKSKENEAMRKALMVAQNNLRAIQEASTGAPDRERQLTNLKATQRFMQERPVARAR
jgi:hypothetical protein